MARFHHTSRVPTSQTTIAHIAILTVDQSHNGAPEGAPFDLLFDNPGSTRRLTNHDRLAKRAMKFSSRSEHAMSSHALQRVETLDNLPESRERRHNTRTLRASRNGS